MPKRALGSVLAGLLVAGVAVVASTSQVLGAAGDISTVAGLSILGDGAIASQAAILSPTAVVFDSGGNMYIADTGHHRVRKVDAVSGFITTIAGTGYGGYSGDNGPATSAKLQSPTSVAVDTIGNIYIADSANHRVRRVAPGGTISTVAGTGSYGFGGDGGQAASAQLWEPQSVAVDSNDNLYIADSTNQRIRKVTKATAVITTVAGHAVGGTFGGDGGPATSASLNYPYAITIDGSDNLYISDTGNHRVRKVTTATGEINTIAGNGDPGFGGDGSAATDAKLWFPRGLAVDSSGNIYIADNTNNRVRKVTTATGIISTIAGSVLSGFGGDGGPATSGSLSSPLGVAIDFSGDIHIADADNHRVRKVTTATGQLSTVVGVGLSGSSGDGGPATSARLNTPYGVELDSAGNLYIADKDNGRIRKVTPGGTISTVAGGGSGVDGDLAVDAYLSGPTDIAFDTAGNLYIAEGSAYLIRKVDKTTGIISTYAGTGLTTPTDEGIDRLATNINIPYSLAFDAAGNLYYSEFQGHKVRKIDASTGLVTTVAGTGTAGAGTDNVAGKDSKIGYPHSIEFDSAGNLFIADSENHTIRKVTMSTGIISTIAGNGTWSYGGDGGPAVDATLGRPSGLAFDAADNLYISEAFNSVIRRIDRTTGTISTLSGTRTTGFSGDGGPAILAQITRPLDLAVDVYGNIFIADTFNHRIRKIALAASPVTTTVSPTTSTLVQPPTVPRKGGLTPKYLAGYLKMTVSKGASVSVSVARSSRKVCAVRKSKLVSLKAGTCRFTVSVKPKKGKTAKRSATLLAQ